MIEEIDKKANEVIRKLSLDTSPFDSGQILNTYSLLKYVVENGKYDEALIDRFDDCDTNGKFEIANMHAFLTEGGRTIGFGCNAVLSYLLRKCGIKSRHATIAEKELDMDDDNTDLHQVTLVRIGDEQIFLDPSMLRLSLENKVIPRINQSAFISKKDFYKLYYPDCDIKAIYEPIERYFQTLNKENTCTKENPALRARTL